MSGFMEILLIVAIILAIFMLPRIMNRKPDRDMPVRNPKMTGWMRLALLGSLLWPALVALYLEPWEAGWQLFLYVAAGPPILAWGFLWVFTGFKKE